MRSTYILYHWYNFSMSSPLLFVHVSICLLWCPFFLSFFTFNSLWIGRFGRVNEKLCQSFYRSISIHFDLDVERRDDVWFVSSLLFEMLLSELDTPFFYASHYTKRMDLVSLYRCCTRYTITIDSDFWTSSTQEKRKKRNGRLSFISFS